MQLGYIVGVSSKTKPLDGGIIEVSLEFIVNYWFIWLGMCIAGLIIIDIIKRKRAQDMAQAIGGFASNVHSLSHEGGFEEGRGMFAAASAGGGWHLFGRILFFVGAGLMLFSMIMSLLQMSA